MRPNSGNLEASSSQVSSSEVSQSGRPEVDPDGSVPVTPLDEGIEGIDPDTPPPGVYATPGDLARAMLTLANGASRCAHLRDNGLRCGSPAMRGDTFCYHHRARRSEATVVRALPRVTDAASFQQALQQVLSDLYAGRVTCRTAGQLLYGLHIAALGLRDFRGLV